MNAEECKLYSDTVDQAARSNTGPLFGDSTDQQKFDRVLSQKSGIELLDEVMLDSSGTIN